MIFCRPSKSRGRPVNSAQLDLTQNEIAFYDALETNDSTVKVLGQSTPKDVARELVRVGRDDVTID